MHLFNIQERMNDHFRVVSVVFIISLLIKKTCGDKLWCYECNTDLSMGHKRDCNDPYLPGSAIDLVACPEDEPHHCLKALIYYKNIHATLRSCVPSRFRNSYCTTNDKFPEALVTCTFCEEYACNLSPRLAVRLSTLLMIFLPSALIVTCNLYHKL
ncbi:uncharacterized protein [Chelonus insularis]|uniref:uncharacterized protein n=1 Tax=Chelonus insularis TaxID=460826 RepID=UPI001589D8BF|nr:uncharacterized protein LOC118064382 [Chelonus insularis]